jgi:hypothetical protein
VVHYRDVVEDDGMGNRKLKVSHRAIAKLLLVTLSFDTKLWVWENTRGKAVRPTRPIVELPLSLTTTLSTRGH